MSNATVPNAKLLRRLEKSGVSEAAKEFYRRHLPPEGFEGNVSKFWGDDYPLIQELEKAGMVMTQLLFTELIPDDKKD
jgi:hypothetical protein